MTFPGWTWEYVDEAMTIQRWNAMNTYWRDHPPLHIMVAGLVGYKPSGGGRPAGPPQPDLPEYED